MEVSNKRTANTNAQALVKVRSDNENAVSIFKEPAQVQRKKKPHILTEEKYIEEMANIIQRDFFPDLDRLRAQNEYLDAMERKDYAQMAALRAKYICTPSQRSGSVTPATFETPVGNSVNNTPGPDASASRTTTPATHINTPNFATTTKSAEATAISEKHSLDSFLQKYTSEDNQSFQEIMERADERLRNKYTVLYRNEQLTAEQLARALELPSIEQQFQRGNEPRRIETWTYKNKNSIMYPPDGVDLTIEEQIDAASKRQSIKHNATRLAMNPFKDAEPTTADGSGTRNTLLSGKIGLDGNALSVKRNDESNAEAVEVRGFNLVMTPSPRPGEAFSPLMTWGEIEGTPFRLDGGDTPLVHSAGSGPHFKISENTRRENIGLALAERAGEKMRAQKQHAMDTARRNMAQRSTPFIRSNIDRLASMSPAARKLMTGKLGLASPLLATPSPRIRMSRSRTPSTRSSDRSKTMVLVNKKSKSTDSVRSENSSNDTDSTLTDNLLKIPNKRLSAADFF